MLNLITTLKCVSSKTVLSKTVLSIKDEINMEIINVLQPVLKDIKDCLYPYHRYIINTNIEELDNFFPNKTFTVDIKDANDNTKIITVKFFTETNHSILYLSGELRKIDELCEIKILLEKNRISEKNSIKCFIGSIHRYPIYQKELNKDSLTTAIRNNFYFENEEMTKSLLSKCELNNKKSEIAIGQLFDLLDEEKLKLDEEKRNFITDTQDVLLKKLGNSKTGARSLVIDFLYKNEENKDKK